MSIGITAIILLISVICLIISYRFTKNTHKINTQIDSQNKELQDKNDELKDTYNSYKNQCDTIQVTLNHKEEEVNKLESTIQKKTNEIAELYKKAEETAATENKIQEQAFLNYCNVLENEYQKQDNEFNKKIESLNQEIEKIKNDLASISSTRAAARAALQREQEVKDNKDNYRLTPSQDDLDDIRRLEIVKRELHKPRILSMLIWQSFWQPLAKRKFPEILQDKTKMGIYKITNLETDECYIGQSVDIYKRWNDHCKCGLGIDTPPGNKLYKAMQEYGLENFAFEILAECPSNELNEKEKYFINLYEADSFGYNSTIGNK